MYMEPKQEKSHGTGKVGEICIRRKFPSEETWRNSRFSKALRDNRRAGVGVGGAPLNVVQARFIQLSKKKAIPINIWVLIRKTMANLLVNLPNGPEHQALVKSRTSE